ncbi:Chromosome partitioning ATPase, Mrp family, contains Fe-S cluster [Aliiroseovarius sediminilitoris]|uniref:Chromosome partitioning ATPase, Mrp family, contains Fe-S cluster n=1 Tax=Aliiroseovarius sediminilitoris TaxID=1173584 RepID=A0A1I0R9R6_9RHOB|nr:CpsD/CapB family tyrosine-protein kinase [Aliiroseovarius sediminilitoris]SEW37504.1 Chromosome partitioning ATPase, Mrp family, contains Fe-S cluster [Aliiroseovarius sediminilitoris]
MEKLQAAIEKARRQRDGKPRARRSQERSSKPPASMPEAWAELEPFDISASLAQKNRLVSLNGGAAAGPFDMLRTRILQQATNNGWKRIALVSPHSACGKTTTAANLIFSFGRQTDLLTMVLDLDLRRQGLAKVLGLQCDGNMGDVLQGKKSFAEHGRRFGENVAVGLNRGEVSNASEILQSNQTKVILDELQDDYEPDIMLLDMPPLIGADDNFGFLQNVDCALLLAEAERTTVEQVDIAERQLSELTTVMGVVLNKSHFSDGAYGYGYGTA